MKIDFILSFPELRKAYLVNFKKNNNIALTIHFPLLLSLLVTVELSSKNHSQDLSRC